MVVADLFKDIIPSILVTKQDVLTAEKDYVPFVVNRALSYHYDCIMPVNAMNMHHEIDHKLQYDFLLNTIRARKRPFQKWIKKETIEDLEAIKEYYDYSTEKAQQALPLFTTDQIDEIKKILEKGGVNAGPRRTNLGKTT